MTALEATFRGQTFKVDGHVYVDQRRTKVYRISEFFAYASGESFAVLINLDNNNRTAASLARLTPITRR